MLLYVTPVNCFIILTVLLILLTRKTNYLTRKEGDQLDDDLNQEEIDLAKEMANLVLPKSSREIGLKLVKAKKIEHSSINKSNDPTVESIINL